VVCLVRPDALVVANAGDSRCVLSRNGQAVPLSEDHKPNLPGERERITKAGGDVLRQQVGSIVQYRVCGNLNLSRSIGDLEYKKNRMLQPCEQMISATPDVLTVRRVAGDEFILLACDGIWDVVGSQEAVDFINERLPRFLKAGKPLSGIMEELLDHCLSPDLHSTQGLGGDNMTALLVVFVGGGMHSELVVVYPSPISSPRSIVGSMSSKGATAADIDESSIGAVGLLCGCSASTR